MKKTKLTALISILLFASSMSVYGQSVQIQNEPEFIGVFMGLKRDGNLVPLDRHKVQTKVSVKALGFGGASGSILVPGEKSKVRFAASEGLEFVVRAPSQQTDPITLIQLYRFETKKGKRQMTIVKVGTMGTNSKNKVTDASVPFDVAKYGESSFRIVLSASLSPGEYFFGVVSEQNPTTDAFCFGIDP